MKRTIILRTVTIVLASMLVLGALVLRTPKVQARHGCSEATLQGEYLFNGRGDAPAYEHAPGLPIVFAGVRTFDGERNLSQVETISLGGSILRGHRDEGVYTLGADCTGTMTIANRNFDIFVNEDGSEGVAIGTDDGRVGSQTFKKR